MPIIKEDIVLTGKFPDMAVEYNRTHVEAAAERFVSIRTIQAEIPEAATILDKLEAAAAIVPDVKWAMRVLNLGESIDIAYPATVAQINALVAVSILTADEANALLNLALQPTTYTGNDIAAALGGA
jgi:hypothetical protein